MTVPHDVFTTMKAQPYDDVRGQIRNGDILLFSGPEVFSRLIQWATNSLWSHVGFVFRLEDIDRLMILEAVTSAGAHAVALSTKIQGNGKTLKPYDGRILVARHRDFEAAANAGTLRNMSCFAVDRFDSPYAANELIKIATRIAAGKLNIKMPPLLKADDEFICSEYAAACYGRIGIDIIWDGLGFIAPCDFANDPKVEAVAVIQTVAR